MLKLELNGNAMVEQLTHGHKFEASYPGTAAPGENSRKSNLFAQ